MENKRGFIMRNGICIGQDVQKVFSTCPLGTVLSFAGQTAPNGYLLCDGASYPTTEYPELYAVIGNTYGGDDTNFNVPDYRETVLVGVGENTTDTIASHDVYELGEFKDDQLQTHTHTETHLNTGDTWGWAGSSFRIDPTLTKQTSNPNNARTGTTTHGKQKGVTYIIKAFHTNEGTDSGVSDDVVEYVDNKINDSATNTNSTWSSSKIASELKTSENTDKTLIEFDTEYASRTASNSNFYTVRNGICYVYMDFTMTVDNPSGKGILANALPKPIGVINCQVAPYNNSTIPLGVFMLDENGSFIADCNLKLGERYLYNFSYPIA